jgi:DNA primase
MAGGRSSSSGRRPRTAAEEADFRRLIDEAKAKIDLSSIVGRHTALKKSGRELVGLCMFHKERSPSLRVNDAKGFYHCFGCGAHGDHFRFLIDHEGLTFQQAYEALTNETFPTVDPSQRAQSAAEDAAERQAAIDEAREFWAAAIDPHGTPAETYILRARGITANIPPSFRFGMVPAWKEDDGRWGPRLPALIGAVTNAADDVIAIQRIFLRDDGLDKRSLKKPKLTLGRYRGGAIKMGNRRPDPEEIGITEGPEDCLSLAQELPDVEWWAALGTANMEVMEFPDTVKRIVIAGQNDGPGRAAVERAALALIERGYSVRIMWPDERFKDWNDQLRGIAR